MSGCPPADPVDRGKKSKRRTATGAPLRVDGLAKGPRGGLIVQDGNNIPPGSPVANINAMTEAAETWGRA